MSNPSSFIVFKGIVPERVINLQYVTKIEYYPDNQGVVFTLISGESLPVAGPAVAGWFENFKLGEDIRTSIPVGN